MKFLLDTNVISEMVKTPPNPHALENIRAHRHEIVIGAPVWHELQYGCRRLPASRKRELIQEFLDDVIRPSIMILPYDDRAAEWHGQERARLTAAGKTPSYVDGQIAAIAHVHNLILVTRNIGDFQAFPDITLENWHEGLRR